MVRRLLGCWRDAQRIKPTAQAILLTELTLKADKAVRAKAMAAMMKQKKIDIAAIEAAVRG